MTVYRYTGQLTDYGTGLYWYRSRWYDPYIGRFLQPDTIVPQPGNPQSLNRYTYVLNNPLRYRDPTGRWVETLWDIANIAWDIYEIRRDPTSLANWGALVVDVGATLVPFVPAGAGLVVRGGKAVAHTDEAVDIARATARLVDSARESERLVQRLAQVGAHTDEGRIIIKELAELSTQGPRSGVVVLGRFRPEPGYKNYIEKALEMEATYFNTHYRTEHSFYTLGVA